MFRRRAAVGLMAVDERKGDNEVGLNVKDGLRASNHRGQEADSRLPAFDGGIDPSLRPNSRTCSCLLPTVTESSQVKHGC